VIIRLLRRTQTEALRKRRYPSLTGVQGGSNDEETRTPTTKKKKKKEKKKNDSIRSSFLSRQQNEHRK
ncbi:hypothetical protein V3C99_016865, partial [Haemonchus contortus]